MTSVKCCRCHRFWSMQTLHPDGFTAIARWCPECVPFALPRVKLEPLKGRHLR